MKSEGRACSGSAVHGGHEEKRADDALVANREPMAKTGWDPKFLDAFCLSCLFGNTFT